MIGHTSHRHVLSARVPRSTLAALALRALTAIALAAAVVAVIAALLVGGHGAARQRTAAALPRGFAARTLPSPPSLAPAPSRSNDGPQQAWYVLTKYLVDNMALRTYPGDYQYFANGTWVDGTTPCWMCNTGPGAAAAVLSLRSGSQSAHYRDLAESTFTTAIRRYQQRNGSFGTPPRGASSSNEITTIFFGVELGEAYAVLEPVLPEWVRSLWASALQRAVEYLVDDAEAFTYYVNGNINLQMTELFYDAWRATNSPDLLRDYNASWNFMLAPGSRWPGYGLVITKPYHTATGSDGAGYLTESGGGAPGFDPDYSQLQLDEATRLWVLSRDPRALLLMNLLTNQLLPRTRPGWDLNTSGGTRHAEVGRLVPFTTSALAVLAWLGGRRDLVGDLRGQLGLARGTMCGALTYASQTYYRAMGNEVSVVLLAADLARNGSMTTKLTAVPACPGLAALQHQLTY
jgi:hypothetical protein